jgi:mRNA interferase MazF
MRFKFGDIVLITFPFVESNTSKKRPALILLDTDDNDIIAARITSQFQKDIYTLEINEWKTCGLLLPSAVKLNKIATINKNHIYVKLGVLQDKDLADIKRMLKEMWGL